MQSNRIEQLENLLSKNPEDAFLCYALAKEFEKENNLHKAIQLLENLANTNINYLPTYYQLGKLYEKTTEVIKALNIYENGIQIAQEQKNLHALSELKTAKLNLELEGL